MTTLTRPSIDASIPFGKHRGRLVSWLATARPNYAFWVSSLPGTRRHPDLWRALQAWWPIAAAALDEIDRMTLEIAQRRQAAWRASVGLPPAPATATVPIAPSDRVRAREDVALQFARRLAWPSRVVVPPELTDLV